MHIIGGPQLPDYFELKDHYEPTWKSEEVEAYLKAFTGVDRRDVIRARMCMPQPIGCGEPIAAFKDLLSEKEYTISGLCQSCQDTVFVDEEPCAGCGALESEPCDPSCECEKWGCP